MSKLKIPEPDLQITFYRRLQEIRRTHLLDALLAAVADLEIAHIDQQLAELTSRSGLRKSQHGGSGVSWYMPFLACWPLIRIYWATIDCCWGSRRSSSMEAGTGLLLSDRWRRVDKLPPATCLA